MASSSTTKEAAAAAAAPPSTAPDAEPTAQEQAQASLEESSRVFVKNLPPNITEDQLRKHFSGGGRHITDLKLIARRRIAFVGYQSPEEAKASVRYFNRTFIRMSKLSVELAKPISDPSLPTALKMQRLHELHASAGEHTQAQSAPAPAPTAEAENAAKKRKREELDAASNPKLREFLEVMKPQTKGGLSSTADVLTGGGAVDVDNGDVQMAVIADAGNESDEEEYQSIANKKAKLSSGDEPDTAKKTDVSMSDAPITRVAAITATAIEEAPAAQAPSPAPEAQPLQPKLDAGATDDDWLRSRTNRLLDLLDPSELETPEALVAAALAAVPAVKVVDASKDDAGDKIQDRNDADKAFTVEDSATTAPTVTVPTPEAVVPAAPLSVEDQIRKTSRLFVRNLPYGATEANLRDYFAAFGAVEEIQLPTTTSGGNKNKGFAMVLFADSAVALAAFHNADGKTFQGRILHVLPAKAKRAVATGELDEFALSKLPLKQQRLLRKKAEAATSSFSWNALFMSQDAVNSAMAERLGMTKSELLDPTSSDEAVRQAVRQTSVIEETKDYFESNGVDLESFKTSTKRGDSCILVKNFAYGTASQEIRKMFEEYGPVVRVLMPPSGTLAIVQYAQPAHGRLAYTKMAYRRIDDTVLMLEKCPDNLLGPSSASLLDVSGPAGKSKLAASDLLEGANAGDESAAAADTPDEAADSKTTSSLFVRNLNFTTTTELLASTFSALAGFVGARVKTKPDPKKPGSILSMGYGFVEFRTKADADGACKAMDGHILQGHTLTVRASHRGAQDAAEVQRDADKAKKMAANHGSKLIVKNIPFEANRTDLRKLLGTYGQLRAVRMPKKFGSSTRGYAFAEFTTPREAAAAMSALRNTHLLGRRLVIEFAAAEAVDAEEEIAKMQKKVGSQMDSVAMQQLATSRSHRAKVTIGEEEET